MPPIKIGSTHMVNFNSILKPCLQLLVLIITGILLAGCEGGKKGQKNYYSLSKEDRTNTKYKGHYKVGKAYKVKGKTYQPKQVKSYNKVGIASWYGTRGFHGKKTANGDIYNKHMLTAAHRTLPLPSLVKVTNLANSKNLIVMVNDRGPYSGSREIDVSEKAADLLGFKQKGTAKVKVQYLHNETQEFLKNIGLKSEQGAKANKKVADGNKCSVNCHIKLVNLKHGSSNKF